MNLKNCNEIAFIDVNNDKLKDVICQVNDTLFIYQSCKETKFKFLPASILFKLPKQTVYYEIYKIDEDVLIFTLQKNFLIIYKLIDKTTKAIGKFKISDNKNLPGNASPSRLNLIKYNNNTFHLIFPVTNKLVVLQIIYGKSGLNLVESREFSQPLRSKLENFTKLADNAGIDVYKNYPILYTTEDEDILAISVGRDKYAEVVELANVSGKKMFSKEKVGKIKQKQSYVSYPPLTPLVIEDIDNDNTLDYALFSQNKCQVYLSNTGGEKNIKFKGTITYSAITDFNNDGFKDLLVIFIEKPNIWSIIKTLFTKKISLSGYIFLFDTKIKNFNEKPSFEFSINQDIMFEMKENLELLTNSAILIDNFNGNKFKGILISSKDKIIIYHNIGGNKFSELNLKNKLLNTHTLVEYNSLDLDNDGFPEIILLLRDKNNELVLNILSRDIAK